MMTCSSSRLTFLKSSAANLAKDRSLSTKTLAAGSVPTPGQETFVNFKTLSNEPRSCLTAPKSLPNSCLPSQLPFERNLLRQTSCPNRFRGRAASRMSPRARNYTSSVSCWKTRFANVVGIKLALPKNWVLHPKRCSPKCAPPASKTDTAGQSQVSLSERNVPESRNPSGIVKFTHFPEGLP